MNARLHLTFLFATALLVLRCDGTESSGSTADVGTAADAANTTTDAGNQVDAGQGDAGSTDAGESEDAGESADAGESVDAGEAADAGETADAGVVDGTQLTASLDGAQVVPPVTTSATGTATFIIDSSRKKLTYSITQNVANASEVEIHIGVTGQNGLTAYALTPVSQSMSGTITITSVHANQLEAGNWYLLVNSPMHTSGEIRGQIEKAP